MWCTLGSLLRATIVTFEIANPGSGGYLRWHRAVGNQRRAEVRASPYLFIVFNMASDTGFGVVVATRISRTLRIFDGMPITTGRAALFRHAHYLTNPQSPAMESRSYQVAH